MKLYAYPPSPNTHKVLAVAAYLGIHLELEVIDIERKQSRTPAFLAINPNGKTPVLDDDGFILWESNAIIQYLASGGSNSLWPKDERARADITRWQCWQLAHWSEGNHILIMENYRKAIADPVAIRKGEAAFSRDAAVLDVHLADRRFLVGDQLTLADISIAAHLVYAEVAKAPLGNYPNVLRWYGAIAAMPAFHDTAPRP